MEDGETRHVGPLPEEFFEPGTDGEPWRLLLEDPEKNEAPAPLPPS